MKLVSRVLVPGLAIAKTALKGFATCLLLATVLGANCPVASIDPPSTTTFTFHRPVLDVQAGSSVGTFLTVYTASPTSETIRVKVAADRPGLHSDLLSAEQFPVNWQGSFTITADADAMTGPRTVTVTDLAGSVLGAFTVDVHGAGTPSFTFHASYETVGARPGQTSSIVQFWIRSVAGFSGDVVVHWSGSQAIPVPTVNDFLVHVTPTEQGYFELGIKNQATHEAPVSITFSASSGEIARSLTINVESHPG